MTLAPALRSGAHFALSRWPVALACMAAAGTEALAAVVLQLALLAAPSGAAALLAGVLGAGVLAALARLLGVVVQVASLRQGAAWLAGRQEEPAVDALWAAAPRATAFWAWTLPLDLWGFLWKWVGLAAVSTGLVTAFVRQRGGVAAAGAFAGFVTVGLLLYALDAVWRRTALVRAVLHDQGVARSLVEAVALVAQRPLARAAAVAVPLAVAVGALLFFNLLAAPFSARAGHGGLELQLAGALAAALPSAMAWAVLELWALQALAALDLPFDGGPRVD